MDVGNPSNFVRLLELFDGDYFEMILRITGRSVTDEEILDTVREVHADQNYLLDPHGAIGYLSLKRDLQPGETGIFLETAHPAKFHQALDQAGIEAPIPDQLARYMDARILSTEMPADYRHFKEFLFETF